MVTYPFQCLYFNIIISYPFQKLTLYSKTVTYNSLATAYSWGSVVGSHSCTSQPLYPAELGSSFTITEYIQGRASFLGRVLDF
jgi:hypothetical protein